MEMGFDTELNESIDEKTNVVELKQKRAPFVLWTVGKDEYKLRLTASVISKLEQKWKRNLMTYLFADGIPTMSDMLTVIQAAMSQHHHGITFLKVQELFDAYVDDGGDQTKLMADVMIPLLEVSGFFTQDQAEALNEGMKTLTR